MKLALSKRYLLKGDTAMQGNWKIAPIVEQYFLEQIFDLPVI